MTPHVEHALEELRLCFPSSALIAEPDGNGGARIILEPVALSPLYSQAETWIGGHITAQIPYADVYPLFIRGDLSRVDGKPLGDALSPGHMFMSRPAVQVSRRSKSRDPAIETPAMKFLKVIDWIHNRP